MSWLVGWLVSGGWVGVSRVGYRQNPSRQGRPLGSPDPFPTLLVAISHIIAGANRSGELLIKVPVDIFGTHTVTERAEPGRIEPARGSC